MALIYHVFYISMHNTIQKYELLQSEALMKEKLNSMKRYKELAETDPLTGVLNRRAFQNQIKSSFISGQVGILIMIDIDNFKHVNDYFGHDTGDEVLRVLSNTLKSSFSSSDIIARLGGDEFAVFFSEEQVNKEQIMQKTVIQIFLIYTRMQIQLYTKQNNREKTVQSFMMKKTNVKLLYFITEEYF